MSAPATTIYICRGVRLNSRYEHSLAFASESAQQTYFRGKVVKTLAAYSYVRRSWTLKVAATMPEASTWNYLFFKNSTSDPSYYYYFINAVEYVNDATVELTLELDVIQTYLFRFELLPCFIERQHTRTDYVGGNTVDEGLDVGEYIDNRKFDFYEPTDLGLIALSNYNLLLNPPHLEGGEMETQYWTYFSMVHGVYSKPGLFFADVVDGEIAAGVTSILELMDEYGYIDAIMTMYMFPRELIDIYDADDVRAFHSVKGVKTLTKTLERNLDIDGYVPRNNKLYQYPYNFIYATNNNGGAALYKYERFTNPSAPSFKLGGSCMPDGGLKCVPANYNGVTENHDEALTLTSFPTCAWDSDPYKIWLAQNQNQQNLSVGLAGLKIVGGVAGAVGGAVTGTLPVAAAGVTSAISGATDIFNTIAQRKDVDVQPPQARGSLSASINVALDKHTFTFYFRSVDATHARIIDDYFTMYGYRLNVVDTPDMFARSRYTYIKTKGCHAVGNLNNADLQKIESIFDNGVTMWVDVNNVGDYTTYNRPIDQQEG